MRISICLWLGAAVGAVSLGWRVFGSWNGSCQPGWALGLNRCLLSPELSQSRASSEDFFFFFSHLKGGKVIQGLVFMQIPFCSLQGISGCQFSWDELVVGMRRGIKKLIKPQAQFSRPTCLGFPLLSCEIPELLGPRLAGLFCFVLFSMAFRKQVPRQSILLI